MVIIRKSKKNSDIYLTEQEYEDCLKDMNFLEMIIDNYKLINESEIKSFELKPLGKSDEQIISMFSQKTKSTYVAKIVIDEIHKQNNEQKIKEIIRKIISESDDLIAPGLPFKFSFEEFLKVTKIAPKKQIKECYIFKNSYYLWIDYTAINIGLEYGRQITIEQGNFIKEHGIKINDFIL